MSRAHSTLYTARQLQGLLRAWESTEPIPKKGLKLVITWPGKEDLEVDLAEVEATPLKGTYGDKLYRATLSSRAGRAFDAMTQEAHVLAFARHRAEERRIQNLARFQHIQP